MTATRTPFCLKRRYASPEAAFRHLRRRHRQHRHLWECFVAEHCECGAFHLALVS